MGFWLFYTLGQRAIWYNWQGVNLESKSLFCWDDQTLPSRIIILDYCLVLFETPSLKHFCLYWQLIWLAIKKLVLDTYKHRAQLNPAIVITIIITSHPTHATWVQSCLPQAGMFYPTPPPGPTLFWEVYFVDKLKYYQYCS